MCTTPCVAPWPRCSLTVTCECVWASADALDLAFAVTCVEISVFFTQCGVVVTDVEGVVLCYVPCPSPSSPTADRADRGIPTAQRSDTVGVSHRHRRGSRGGRQQHIEHEWARGGKCECCRWSTWQSHRRSRGSTRPLASHRGWWTRRKRRTGLGFPDRDSEWCAISGAVATLPTVDDAAPPGGGHQAERTSVRDWTVCIYQCSCRGHVVVVCCCCNSFFRPSHTTTYVQQVGRPSGPAKASSNC